MGQQQHQRGETEVFKRFATAAGAVAFVVALAAPASAHVLIEPNSAPSGSDAVLSFIVPNEMDNANTTQVVIAFPTDHPIADVVLESPPGWTAKVTTAKSAKPIQTDSGPVNDYVSRVTWSGGSIPPGEFQTFSVDVGLPDASSLTFPALQTYSNGQTVRWIETQAPGQPEPDHPAPVLTLTAGDTGSAATTTTAASTSGPSTSGSSSSSSNGSKGLATSALVVAIIALLVGAGSFAVARTRRA